MQAEYALALLATIGFMGGFYYFLKKKHRMIWGEIWLLKEEAQKLRNDNTELSKKIILLESESKGGRLDPIMPSQHGEDVWLWDFFKKKRSGLFVEVGAYDGVTFSNTYFLESMGWSGILIEPNPENFGECKRQRPYSESIQAAVTNSGDAEVTLSVVSGTGGVDALSFTETTERHLSRVKNTGAHIKKVKVPAKKLSDILLDLQPVDFISIDVEGGELDVLESLDFTRHAPTVFIIEDNSHGVDKTVEKYLECRGFKFCKRLGANQVFIRAEQLSRSSEE